MPTAFSYSATVSMPNVALAFNSVGAHIAAKLDSFDSDERTLTDELCDMSCVWNVHGARILTVQGAQTGGLPSATFQITFGKISSREEAFNGADLRLVLTTPMGTKEALFQAKAIDPSTLDFRRNSAADWARLRRQLSLMRRRVGDCAFLLAYVPGSELDGRVHGFGTWEQWFLSTHTGSTDSRFGTTAIPADSLLHPNGRWIRNRVQYNRGGTFSPVGFSLSRILLELVSCRRGSYSRSPKTGNIEPDNNTRDFRTLSITIGEANEETWATIVETTRKWLDSNPETGTTSI